MEKCKIRAITPLNVIQNHRGRYQSKVICDFLLVINWHAISYRFGVIAAYCSKFYYLYTYLILDDVGLGKLMLLYVPLCTVVKAVLEVVNWACRNHSSWKTVPGIHDTLHIAFLSALCGGGQPQGQRTVFFLGSLESALNSYSVNWFFFARCYGWGATGENRSKIGDFAPSGQFDPKFQVEGVAPHQTFSHAYS